MFYASIAILYLNKQPLSKQLNTMPYTAFDWVVGYEFYFPPVAIRSQAEIVLNSIK